MAYSDLLDHTAQPICNRCASLSGQAPFTAGEKLHRSLKPIGPQPANQGEPAFLSEQQRYIDGEIIREFFRIGESSRGEPGQFMEQKHRWLVGAVIEAEDRMSDARARERLIETLNPIPSRRTFFFCM